MGKYKLALSDRAKSHLAEWKMSGQLISIRKIEKIIIELSIYLFVKIIEIKQNSYNIYFFIYK